jgi:phosphoglycerate kinase
LGELLGKQVQLAPDCVGAQVEALVQTMEDGECILLENLRFHAEEEANDPNFAKQLASLADIYVNDAFGTAHRAHASTEGITRFVGMSAAGYLMKKELDYLGKVVANPVRPYTAILGGAKISGKIDVIQNLLNSVDSLLIGGGMMFTFLKAQGVGVGDSMVEEEKVPLARRVLEETQARNLRFLLPVDCIVADRFENDAETRCVDVRSIPDGWRGLDIGPDTVELFKKEVLKSKTIVWNGPMGVLEMKNFASGTMAIAEALAEATKRGATTVVGGGDSAAAIAEAGLQRAVSHVSTGGGASLEFLEGRVLPGVAALSDKD